MNPDQGFDWSSAIVLANDFGQQWYSLITQKPIPTQEGVSVTPGGLRVTAGTNTTIILVAVLAVAAIVLLKK
jgi:hypothetical protein